MDYKIILGAIYCLLLGFSILGGFAFWAFILTLLCDWFEDTRELRKEIVRKRYYKRLTNKKEYDIIGIENNLKESEVK